MERKKRVCVRVSPDEEAMLKDAAWRQRLSLSEWVRQTMLREAQKVEQKPPLKRGPSDA
jgi:uncharacterized protein (DUF1778 family)